MIAMLTPSFGRPEMFKEAYDVALDLADDPSNIFVVLRLDHDETPANVKMYRKALRSSDKLVFGDSNHSTELYQELYEQFNTYDIYICFSDDVFCRTPHWDTKMLDYVKNVPGNPPVAMMRISDGMDITSTFFFWTKGWISALGFILPQNLLGAQDLYVNAIGEILLELGYEQHYSFAKDIVFEHMHFIFGKREKDTTDTMRGERIKDIGRRVAFDDAVIAIPLQVDDLVAAIQASLAT